jgi:DNA-binding CsgD family transcriptional regulator
MREKQFTYKQFLKKIENFSARVIEENVEGILQHFQPPKSISTRFGPVTFLLDYTTRKYLYIEESTCFDVMGYTADFFMEYGLDEFNRKWHPADFDVLDTKVFRDNFAFFKQVPVEDYYKYVVSYNYRFKNPSDQYNAVLQRFSFIPGKVPGDLVGVVGIAFDITHFKNDTTIVHTIEKVENTSSGNLNKLMFKKIHPVYDQPDDRLLSKRENEILGLLAGGLSSKQIASAMQISINTVNNHRKSMLQKTSSRSSSELISYATKHGLV